MATGVREDQGRAARALVEKLRKRAKERDRARWNELRYGLRCYDHVAAADADMLNEAAKTIEELL